MRSRASALQHSVSRGDLLMIGALLHDIGKAYPELGDHSEHGAPMAARIARRMGFAEDDVATVECLVRHHLLLPDVATRRDVSDPATAKFVAETVGSSERIALLRLTEADSIATGPAAWSDWKAGLVEQLATRAMEYVDGRRDEPAPRVFPTVAQRRLLEGPACTSRRWRPDPRCPTTGPGCSPGWPGPWRSTDSMWSRRTSIRRRPCPG
ncbi:MAG: HD domain-containing protein [Microthrixaceae bacterium]